MISYAQNFEDVMLERLFAGQTCGCYIDVGAWDPHALSITKHFYLKGWRGINIEPLPGCYERFRTERPDDINLNVVISSAEGPRAFFECVEESYLSTIDPGIAEDLRNRGLTVVEHRVEAKRLDGVIREHISSSIEFLKVDVEGAEAEVLSTVDLRRWRPCVLVIESIKPGVSPSDWAAPDSNANWMEWEPAVLSHGYVFAHFDGINRFYVRKEDAYLAKRLQLPPCLFDDIRYPSTVLAEERAAKFEDECARQLVTIEDLSGRISELANENAELLATNESLRGRISELADESAELLATTENLRASNESLRARISELEKDRGECLTLLDELRIQLRAQEELRYIWKLIWKKIRGN